MKSIHHDLNANKPKRKPFFQMKVLQNLLVIFENMGIISLPLTGLCGFVFHCFIVQFYSWATQFQWESITGSSYNDVVHCAIWNPIYVCTMQPQRIKIINTTITKYIHMKKKEKTASELEREKERKWNEKCVHNSRFVSTKEEKKWNKDCWKK